MFLHTKGIHPPIRISHHTMDVGCVRLFKFLLDETGAKFVISSSWRKETKAKSVDVFKAMAWCGFEDAYKYCVGVTPRMGWRGTEIDYWLTHNETEYFVVIDDDAADIHQKDQFVRTQHEIGLTVPDVYKAIDIFNLNLDYIIKPLDKRYEE